MNSTHILDGVFAMSAANAYYSNSYYLWDPRDGITVGPMIEKEAGLLKVALGQLGQALQELSKKAEELGRARSLEIHCHGDPAHFRLGSDIGVHPGNVAWFGSQLRSAIVPGGTIEILACRVAGQSVWSGSLMTSTPTDIDGYVATYHGKLQELYKDKNWTRGVAGLIFTGAEQSQKTIRPFKVNSRYTVDPNHDGMEFCRSLSRASAAIVRASISSQAEDGTENDSPLTPSVSPIGNWEGPVFDFYPDQTIKFVGMAPFRQSSWGPIRMDLDFPLGNA